MANRGFSAANRGVISKTAVNRGWTHCGNDKPRFLRFKWRCEKQTETAVLRSCGLVESNRGVSTGENRDFKETRFSENEPRLGEIEVYNGLIYHGTLDLNRGLFTSRFQRFRDRGFN